MRKTPTSRAQTSAAALDTPFVASRTAGAKSAKAPTAKATTVARDKNVDLFFVYSLFAVSQLNSANL
jgi:hypothetical protein